MTGTESNVWEPETGLSRAMLVTILYRLAGSPSISNYRNPFTDVPTSSYYYKPVIWAYRNGITNGTTATLFSPDETVTRTQAVVMMYRYANKRNYKFTQKSINTWDYPDLSTMSGETYNAWLWGLKIGLVDGYLEGTYYYLNGAYTLTRMQAAKFINSLQGLSGNWLS